MEFHTKPHLSKLDENITAKPIFSVHQTHLLSKMSYPVSILIEVIVKVIIKPIYERGNIYDSVIKSADNTNV